MNAPNYEIIIRRKHELVAAPGISIHELSRRCECQLEVIRRLMAVGFLEPLPHGMRSQFDAGSVIRVRKALRIKRDLRLNFEAVALVMELLDRIEELERSGGRSRV